MSLPKTGLAKSFQVAVSIQIVLQMVIVAVIFSYLQLFQ